MNEYPDNNENNCEPENEMERIHAEAEAKYQKALELEQSMRKGFNTIRKNGIETISNHETPDGKKFDVKNTLQLMIDYFADSAREEYEKCAFLHNILINL